MKASQRSLTIVEVLVIIFGVLFVLLLLFLYGGIISPRAEARKDKCKENLIQIGRATAAYREDNGGYFPFSWQRAGEAEPLVTGAANAAMAATSLGNLYPRYVKDAKLFHCPSTEDQPSFVLNLPWKYRNVGQGAGFAGALPQGSNWTLTGNQPLNPNAGPSYSMAIKASSYGYDPRISPRATGGHVVAADMDGNWGHQADTVSNHADGQNVLYVDGHAAWKATNFCSNDPNDNIFVEDKWDADTDSYLVDMDAGLGVSFDGYGHLHYARKTKPITR